MFVSQYFTIYDILVTAFHPRDDSLRRVVNKNWSLLGRSHRTLPVFNRRLLTAYKRPQNLKDLLVRADCALPSTHPPALGTHPTPPVGPTFNPCTKQIAITDFFRDRLITSSSSLTDVTTQVGHSPHSSISLTFPSKPSRRKCTNSKCIFCPLLSMLVCWVDKNKIYLKINVPVQIAQ